MMKTRGVNNYNSRNDIDDIANHAWFEEVLECVAKVVRLETKQSYPGATATAAGLI